MLTAKIIEIHRAVENFPAKSFPVKSSLVKTLASRALNGKVITGKLSTDKVFERNTYLTALITVVILLLNIFK